MSDVRRTEGWGDHDADCCRSRCGTWPMSVPHVATFLGWARDGIGPICGQRKRSEFLAPAFFGSVGGTPDAGLVLDDDVMNLKGDWEFSAQNRPEGWNVWLTFSLSSAPSASPPPAVH
jgi:hypothetical protein